MKQAHGSLGFLPIRSNNSSSEIADGAFFEGDWRVKRIER